MLPDRVSNPGPLTYESGALLIALCGSAQVYGTGIDHIMAGIEQICLNFRVYGSGIDHIMTGIDHTCLKVSSVWEWYRPYHDWN